MKVHRMHTLIPRPRLFTEAEGEFVLNGTVAIAAVPDAVDAVATLTERLWAGARIRVEVVDQAPTGIRFVMDATLAPESHRVDVATDGLSITAADAAGFLHGTTTVLQLMGDGIWRSVSATARTVTVPACRIEDEPAFAWRGIMLDVARHFLPVREVLRIVDLMAMHKLNRLHFHLTDDQGWRIEIRAFPRLTEVGAWRDRTQVGADDATAPEIERPHGGYYTQADISEIVAYAANRGIVVVPEIDLPGHSQAAIAAYPDLGVPDADGHPPTVEVYQRWGISPYPLNAETSTVDFFRTVLDEVLALFPSVDIGLGGDEVPSGAWEADARSRELALERGLSHPRELQFWFLDQLRAHIEQQGRRMLAWDEVLEHDVSPDVTVLGWRGDAGIGESLRRGIPVIACPDNRLYFDYRQSDDPREPIPVGVVVGLRDVYSFNPVPEWATAEQAVLLRGAQANLWAEHMEDARSRDYMLWPRACALAEALWSGPGGAFEEFETRLQSHLGRLDERGVEHRRAGGPLPWQERPGVGGRVQEPEQRQQEIDALTAAIVR
ncbi:beta-N-acetylhexosaminidase [Mycetocola zhujimingii]|uniref:beta-N-acetylhexosaminidase n=2 Tax=Mycetocola zhujimingii TaxID=2079792 RepID=A0A2U1TCN7_9MICO|nr:beta-N-acetylhexosaminidase [Mycetocola zhujimingii]